MSRYEQGQNGQPTSDYFRMAEQARSEGAFWAKDFIDEPLPTIEGVMLEVDKIFAVEKCQKENRVQKNFVDNMNI